MIPAHVTRMSSEPPCRPRPRPPPRRPRASSRRSARRDRRSPAPSPAPLPRRSRRRRPSRPPPRGASPSRRRCPSRRPSRALSSLESRHARTTIYGAGVEFRDILGRRRMHRAFLPDPLPREQIERIVGVIRRAPSGGFSQGGSIVVVTDAEQRARDRERFRRRALLARRPQLHRRRAGPAWCISANESLYHARYNEADKLQRPAASR